MSARKTLLALLLDAKQRRTYDELLAAMGVTRHNLSNALSDLRRDGIVESVPETFGIGEVGRAVLKRQALEAVDRKARATRKRKARVLERKRERRAEEKAARVALLPPVELPAPVPFKVPMHVPSSVFDMARAMGVTA